MSGVQIPLRFWKIAAWAQTPDATGNPGTPGDGGGAVVLAATGYVLDQTPQLDDTDLATARALAAGLPPPLGLFRTFQVPITDIATLTGLDLGPLSAADRFAVAAPVGAAELTPGADTATGRCRLLGTHADVTL